MSIIQLPNHSTFYQWFMDLNRSRPDLIIPTPPQNDTDWKKWAMLLISINNSALSRVVLPIGDEYKSDDSWRKWAYFLIEN